MITYAFVGNVDKRILVLPVAKALQGSKGETLIITDDPNYLRGTDNNVLSPVKVYFAPVIDNNTVNKLDDGVDYQVVIYDTREFIPETRDELIACRMKDRRLLADKIKEVTDEVDKNGEVVNASKEVVLTYNFNKAELKKSHYTDRGEHEDVLGKATVIELKVTDFKWLWICEETAQILQFKNPDLLNVIAELTCEPTGMPAKDWKAVLER